jgi:hypothetical protein
LPNERLAKKLRHPHKEMGNSRKKCAQIEHLGQAWGASFEEEKPSLKVKER